MVKIIIDRVAMVRKAHTGHNSLPTTADSNWVNKSKTLELGMIDDSNRKEDLK